MTRSLTLAVLTCSHFRSRAMSHAGCARQRACDNIRARKIHKLQHEAVVNYYSAWQTFVCRRSHAGERDWRQAV